MTGYESFAQVIACGADVEHLRVGDRVVAFYGHRTHAVLAADRVIPVPETMPPSLALLVILACDVMKGIMKLAIQPHEPVLITGAGAIGLLAVFNLVARNVRQVDVIEPIAHRRALAAQLGAGRTVAPQEPAALNNAYHVAIECSSSNAAFTLLQEHMGYAGRLCILADGNLEPLTLLPAFHEKELQVMGSSDGEDYQGYALWFWSHVQHAAAQLERLYEKTTSAERLANTFAEIAALNHPPIKVLVQYAR
jgi:alcohol dehydrogenase